MTMAWRAVVFCIILLASSISDGKTQEQPSVEEHLVEDDDPLDNIRVRKSITASCLPMLILQNVNGSVSFNRSWVEYKAGFDDGRGNYWLGNEILHQLTVNGNFRLRVDLQSVSGSKWYWAEYSTFIVLSESANYKLHVAGYSGNAICDSMAYHDGMMFSTYDRDNDAWKTGKCANTTIYGGFWYKGCRYYAPTSWVKGHYLWSKLPGDQNLKSTRMWLMCP